MRERVKQESNPTLKLHQLPHLPDWAAPNGWDFWGRPWAYMDTPSGHSAVGVTSDTRSTWVTMAVLVCLDWELQYLSDQNVAKSAGAAETWLRKTRVFHDDGSLREGPKFSPFSVALTLYPHGWGDGRCEAVHSLLNCWHPFLAG